MTVGSSFFLNTRYHRTSDLGNVFQTQTGGKTGFIFLVGFSLVLLLQFLVGPAIAHVAELPDLFKKVKDSVVVIYTVERGWQAEEKKLVTARGIGSGVIISNDGLIMTAAHVVQVADALEIHFRNGTSAKATVVSSSPRTDLALLKVSGPIPADLQVADIGESRHLEVGDGLFAIGAPNGIAYTLTSGHVSNVLSTGIKALQNSEVEMILTDAGIDVGNSGGPLFNLQGQVVGIVNQFFPFEKNRGAMGAAVTIHSAQDILLRDQPFWSGMELYMLPVHLARALNVPDGGSGFLVQRIAKGSPAESAGLRAGQIRASLGDVDVMIGGDIIVKVNGLLIQGGKDSVRQILECICENKQVELTVIRGGELLTVQLHAPKK